MTPIEFYKRIGKLNERWNWLMSNYILTIRELGIEDEAERFCKYWKGQAKRKATCDVNIPTRALRVEMFQANTHYKRLMKITR